MARFEDAMLVLGNMDSGQKAGIVSSECVGDDRVLVRFPASDTIVWRLRRSSSWCSSRETRVATLGVEWFWAITRD